MTVEENESTHNRSLLFSKFFGTVAYVRVGA